MASESLEINKGIKRGYLTFALPLPEKIGRVRKPLSCLILLSAGRFRNENGVDTPLFSLQPVPCSLSCILLNPKSKV